MTSLNGYNEAIALHYNDFISKYFPFSLEQKQSQETHFESSDSETEE